MNNRKKIFSFFDFVFFPYRENRSFLWLSIVRLCYAAAIPWLTVHFLSNIIELIRSDQLGSRPFFLYIGAYVLLCFVSHFFHSTYKFLSTGTRLSVKFRIEDLYIRLIRNSTFEQLENQEYYNDLQLLKENFFDKYIEHHNSTLNFFSLCAELLSLCLIIFSYIGMSSFVILIATIPMILTVYYNEKFYFKENQKIAYDIRFADEIYEIRVGKKFSFERKWTAIHSFLQSIWQSSIQKVIQSKQRVFIKNLFRLEFSSIIIGIAFFYTIVRMTSLRMDVTALLVPLILQISNFLEVLRWSLNSFIESYTELKQSLKLYNRLITPDTLSQTHNNGFEQIKSIEFKNVSFKYPSTDRYVLKNVSFRIEAPCKVAIVGENGSGKTTLVKLLTRMYSDYEGSILINDQDLREIEGDPFSIIYQDFAKFYLNIDDNIAVGNPKAGPSAIDSMKELFHLQNIPTSAILRNYDEENLNLSGGQWQSIAISRALIGAGEVLIMDEPNSALDVKNETALYKFFVENEKNPISLLVTHRLVATKFVDSILLIKNGQVHQSGSFAELMEDKENAFYHMYSHQGGLYGKDF